MAFNESGHYRGRGPCLFSQLRDEECTQDINSKLHKYQLICGTLRNKATRKTKLKFNKVIAASVLTCGREMGTFNVYK